MAFDQREDADRDAVRRELDRALEAWKRDQRIRDAANDMLEALRPFLPAYHAYVETMQTFVCDGETSAERRFSEGERRDSASENAFEELAKVTFEQLSAVASAISKAEGRS